MPRAKHIVLALASLEKAAKSVQLPKGIESLFSAGQNFVGVGLMPYIPDQFIFRRVVYIVKSNRQLHSAQPGTKVSSGF
jgi:hypothetical protein